LISALAIKENIDKTKIEKMMWKMGDLGDVAHSLCTQESQNMSNKEVLDVIDQINSA